MIDDEKIAELIRNTGFRLRGDDPASVTVNDGSREMDLFIKPMGNIVLVETGKLFKQRWYVARNKLE
jgi:hypothetical protein